MKLFRFRLAPLVALTALGVAVTPPAIAQPAKSDAPPAKTAAPPAKTDAPPAKAGAQPAKTDGQSAKGDDRPRSSAKVLDRGRYLAKIAGCNDCHTPQYMEKNGKIPEKDWLTGDSFGWRGPWGTTYAVNLRLYMQGMTEEEWLKKAASVETRPPMPWWVLREMSRDDLRSLYRYIRELGPAGKAAPAFLPPDKEPKPPYATFPAPPK